MSASDKDIACTTNKTNKLPLILNGKFFSVEQSAPYKKYSNISAKCVTCNKEIRGTLCSTSNFLLHLKTKHSCLLQEYYQLKELTYENLL